MRTQNRNHTFDQQDASAGGETEFYVAAVGAPPPKPRIAAGAIS